MYFPKLLRPKACVGLIAPGSPITKEQRLACERKLAEMGFLVVTGKALKKDSNCHGYLAGTARERAADVNGMFLDERIEAIFCTRGGYGCFELLPYLNYEQIAGNPKLFVGYSDITALHTVLQRYCNLVTFHGPMALPDFLPRWEKYTTDCLWAACNMGVSFRFENPPGEKLTALWQGKAQGKLLGGNLSVLARSLGTVYGPKREECILFLEDVGESIPRIHMYLTQLNYAGMLQGVRGVLLGDFTGCDLEADDTLTASAFLKNWFGQLQVPVIGNVCSDHRRPMGTLPLGAFCRMEATVSGEAEILFFQNETEGKRG